MISLVICSRVSGNENWSLLWLLETLKKKSASHDNFEVLVKFDTDDEDVPKVLPALQDFPFAVKHLIEPRGRGYIDIHIGYTRVYSLADPRTTVVGAFADDFEVIQDGWDELILQKASLFPDQIFILHGRPHPPYQRDNYQEQMFFLDYDLDPVLDTIEIIDEAPFWGRKLLDICGGLGHVSFTDAWTLALEHHLYHKFKIERTVFLDAPIVYRKLNPAVDFKMSQRWWTDRASNFEFMQTNFYRTIVEQQALNIHLNIASNVQLHRLLAREPFNAAAHYQLSEQLYRQERREEARTELELAIAVDPSYIPARLSLARLWWQEGKHRDAIELLTRTAEAGHANGELLSLLAEMLMGSGLAEEEPERLDRLVEYETRDAGTYLSLGLFLYQSGRDSAAEAAFTSALNLAPERPDVHSHFSAFCLGKRRLDKALDHARRALELAPENLQLAVKYALVLDASGQVGPAVQLLEGHPGLEADADARWQLNRIRQKLSGDEAS